MDYSDQEEEIAFENLLSYPVTLEQAVQNMIARGVRPADIDFTAPNTGSFATPPHGKKVFHPQGGGVQYRAQPEPGYAPYVYNKSSSIIGLGTRGAYGGTEIIFGAQVSLEVCRNLNERFYGSNAIPNAGEANLATFLSGGAEEFYINITGKKHQCVTDLDGGQPAAGNWNHKNPKTYLAGLSLPRMPDLGLPPHFQRVMGSPSPPPPPPLPSPPVGTSAGNEIYVYLHVLAVQ